MDELYKKLGVYKEGDPIEKVECTVCGATNEIPLYINIGRYTPALLWCWKCGQSYKYWRFFGCHKPGEIEGWILYPATSKRTGGKVIEKE